MHSNHLRPANSAYQFWLPLSNNTTPTFGSSDLRLRRFEPCWTSVPEWRNQNLVTLGWDELWQMRLRAVRVGRAIVAWQANLQNKAQCCPNSAVSNNFLFTSIRTVRRTGPVPISVRAFSVWSRFSRHSYSLTGYVRSSVTSKISKADHKFKTCGLSENYLTPSSKNV